MSKQFLFLISLIFSLDMAAQVPRNMPITTTEKTTAFDGKARLELKPALCFSFEDSYTGVDAINNGVVEPIKIGTGGGIRIEVDLGYTMASRIDFSLGIGFQYTVGAPIVKDGSVTWTSFYLEPMIGYGFKLTDRKKITAGVGLHTSVASNMLIDFKQNNTTQSFKFGYGTNFGAAAKVEFENKLRNKNLSFKGGLRFHWVTSELKTVTVNGQSLPLNRLTPQQESIWNKLQSGGVGAYFGLCFYF